MACDGPDALALTGLTKQCSCLAEWYGHSSIFVFGLATSVYVILYLSSLLIHRGLLMMEWRHLRPEVYEYIASCDANGQLIDSSQGGKSRSSLRETLEEKVAMYENFGFAYVFVGAAINIIWIALILVAARSISYVP